MFKKNSNNFFIKKGYKSRDSYHHYDDMKMTDQWQNRVYLKAYEETVKKGYDTVLDIGCGSGFKLNKYFHNKKTIGLELEENIETLRKKYPNNRWELSDFKNPFKETVDMIICSDVIEHLVDPDELLEYIYNIDFKTCVLSTPERDVIYGKDSMGPPNQNLSHVREWNTEELYKYIQDNFDIIEHYVDKANEAHTVKQCQIIVFEKKRKV